MQSEEYTQGYCVIDEYPNASELDCPYGDESDGRRKDWLRGFNDRMCHECPEDCEPV